MYRNIKGNCFNLDLRRAFVRNGEPVLYSYNNVIISYQQETEVTNYLLHEDIKCKINSKSLIVIDKWDIIVKKKRPMDHITNLCNTNHNTISFLEFHPKYINNVEEYILFKKKIKVFSSCVRYSALCVTGWVRSHITYWALQFSLWS